METKRQKQVSRLIQVSLSEIFQRDLQDIVKNALVTITSVHITPDLFITRVYVSIFNHQKPDELIAILNEKSKLIRGLLGNKIKNKMRTIPELEFFKDDTLDEVFKVNKLLDEVKSKDEAIAKLRSQASEEEE